MMSADPGSVPLVAIIDSGLSPDLTGRAVAARGFAAVSDGVEDAAVTADAVGHGSAVARLVTEAAPAARLLNAQIFHDRAATTPVVVAAALRWAVARRADIAVLSLGMRSDREALREACAEAVAAGMILVASAPARGLPVYPAAYPGVLRVSGDARCAAGEVSWFGDGIAEYGTCSLLVHGAAPTGGASFAAARLAGLLAAALWSGDLEPGQDPHAYLRARARFTGRERRLG
ncbi:S8 family serine peptidase [Novispirillum sp. DQ9]|uniref:subtilisin-like serine protease QhpE n=1 Tax=Novispirillum sp. DQ9 TaxID=3398612 RepID=UPI003C7ED94C